MQCPEKLKFQHRMWLRPSASQLLDVSRTAAPHAPPASKSKSPSRSVEPETMQHSTQTVSGQDMATMLQAFSESKVERTSIEDWASGVILEPPIELAKDELLAPLDIAKLQIDECTSILKGLRRSEPSQEAKIDALLSNLQLWIQSYSGSERAGIWQGAEDLLGIVLGILEKLLESLNKSEFHRNLTRYFSFVYHLVFAERKPHQASSTQETTSKTPKSEFMSLAYILEPTECSSARMEDDTSPGAINDAGDSDSDESFTSDSDTSDASSSESTSSVSHRRTSIGVGAECSESSGRPPKHIATDAQSQCDKAVRQSLKRAFEYASCLMDTLSTMEQVFSIVSANAQPDAHMGVEVGEVDATGSGTNVVPYLHRDTMKKMESLGAAWPYYTKVKDMFEGVPDVLASRLAETNWKRHMSLRSGEVPFAEGRLADPQKASTVITKSTFVDSGFAGSEDVAEALPQLNQCLEAPSLQNSDQSYRTTETSLKRGSLRVPAPPAGFDSGDPFECPICSNVVHISTRAQWK